jgi:hypothetical protein
MATEPKGNYQAIDRKEHDKDAVAKRVIQTDPFGGAVTEGNYTQLMDDTTPNVYYFGLSQIGTDTSVSGWQIYKTDLTTSPKKLKVWANGTDAFTNKWDDRATYTYA